MGLKTKPTLKTMSDFRVIASEENRTATYSVLSASLKEDFYVDELKWHGIAICLLSTCTFSRAAVSTYLWLQALTHNLENDDFNRDDLENR